MNTWMQEVTWMQRANCRDMDTELFFPEVGQKTPVFVRELCNTCDVRVECLNYAQRHMLTDGMWGGYTPTQRRQMRGRHVYS